jgi:hypothetical protein
MSDEQGRRTSEVGGGIPDGKEGSSSAREIPDEEAPQGNRQPGGKEEMGTEAEEEGVRQMTPQLTLMQLWTLLAGGPIAMVLTVLVGILVNNAITKANIAALRSDIQRIEGVLGTKIDALTVRVKALEDEIHSPLVKQ